MKPEDHCVRPEGEKFFRIKESDGGLPAKKEEVKFYEGFGWLTDEELFDLRQKEPRIAP